MIRSDSGSKIRESTYKTQFPIFFFSFQKPSIRNGLRAEFFRFESFWGGDHEFVIEMSQLGVLVQKPATQKWLFRKDFEFFKISGEGRLFVRGQLSV